MYVCVTVCTCVGPIVEAKQRFLPNEFPYQAPAGTRHYVQWYSLPPDMRVEELTDDVVSGDIAAALWGVVGSDDFEFVWYPNPKPSCDHSDSRLFHVQVFWRCGSDDGS